MALLGNLAGPSCLAGSSRLAGPSGLAGSTSLAVPSNASYSQPSSSFFSGLGVASTSSVTSSSFRIGQELTNQLQHLFLGDSKPMKLFNCEKCGSSTPDGYKCLNCVQFLCPPCRIAHIRNPTTRDHAVGYCKSREHNDLSNSSGDSCSPPPLASPPRRNYCTEHGAPAKSLCEKCLKILCHSCSGFTFGCNHKPIRIQEAIAKARRLYLHYNTELERIIRDVTEGIQRAEISRMHSEQSSSMVQADLYDNYKRLEQEYHRLNAEVKNEKLRKQKSLAMHRNRLEMILMKTRSLTQVFKDSLQSDNVVDVVWAKERVAREIKRFKQSEIMVLFADMNEFTFVPPDHDLLRNLILPERPTLNINWEGRDRPIHGVSQQIIVKQPQGNANTIVMGELGQEEGQLCRPWGVCCNQQGQIIIVDRSNDRIQVFNSDLTFVRAFGCRGSGRGQFNRPAGVAASPNGQIVVADKDNHRVQVFTIEGQFIRIIGRKGSFNGQFNYPWDVACNHRGQILVSDTRNHRVQLFDPNGRFLALYGHETNPDVHKIFDMPRGVCFTPSGEIIISDFNFHRLVVLDSNLEQQYEISCEGDELGRFRRPQGIICDDSGNIIVADSKNDRIQVLDCEGNFLWSVGRTGENVGELTTPCGLCLTPEGRIAVIDYANSRLQIF